MQAGAPSSYELGASSRWRKTAGWVTKGKSGANKSTASHHGFSGDPVVFDS